MLEQYVTNNDTTVSDIFLDTRDLVTKQLSTLANAILTCTMKDFSATLFFEAKAKEWLSITLDAYAQKKQIPAITPRDEKAIENVSKYIDNHLTYDIEQGLLEKIALMSGTKLKNVFKQKYQMSITEYTQRKRMNMAENLLLTTDLPIKDIAKTVGYHSSSRFTTLFKRYKNRYPKELKQSKNKRLI